MWKDIRIYATCLESKRVDCDEDGNVEQIREQVK